MRLSIKDIKSDHAEKQTAVDHKKETAPPVAVPGDVIQADTMQADIIPSVNSGALSASPDGDMLHDTLPADIAEKIEGVIAGYMSKFHIDDMKKATAEQWRGACMIVGDYIQSSNLLKDSSATLYNTDNILHLLKLWAALCAVYSKPTLATDFIAFTGISSSYFYDNAGHELTSGRAEIRKKMMELQEAGLASGLVDGRKNPTGTIFFLKNWHGWKDQREVVHTAGGSSVGADSLPRLGGPGGDNGNI